MKRVAAVVLLLALLGTAACGDPVVVISEVENISHGPKAPPWAKVAPEQIAEAKKHGVPVAFENDLGMRFVLIPAGTFLMGSPKDEEERDLLGSKTLEDQHEVTLTEPFYIQVTEVTNAQYRAWKGDHTSGPCKSRRWSGDTTQYHDTNGGTQPVIRVDWHDATGLSRWLSASDDSRGYDLPSDAQWEYACRAGTTTVFSFGDSITSDQANFHGKFPYGEPYGDPSSERYDALYPDSDPGHYRGVTTSVGRFPANRWGLHDMHGNVSEWCSDWMDWGLAGPVTDPHGPPSGEYRVVRGGAWHLPGSLLRSATRFWLRPDSGPASNVGFRLVSPLPEPKSSK